MLYVRLTPPGYGRNRGGIVYAHPRRVVFGLDGDDVELALDLARRALAKHQQ